MSDISNDIKRNTKLQKVMYNSLMAFGTLYDGKERLTELTQGSLAEGDFQNALQIGTIIKGEPHEVSIDATLRNSPWLVHTHAKRKNQTYHPPSLIDILLTIERAANDRGYKGISIIVAVEGFYILYPNRELIEKLNTKNNFDTNLSKRIRSDYPRIFNKTTKGKMSPDDLGKHLMSYGIICNFINYDL